MRKSRFSQTEPDSISRPESLGDSNPRVLTTSGFRDASFPNGARGECGCAHYNRGLGSLWSRGDLYCHISMAMDCGVKVGLKCRENGTGRCFGGHGLLSTLSRLSEVSQPRLDVVVSNAYRMIGVADDALAVDEECVRNA